MMDKGKGEMREKWQQLENERDEIKKSVQEKADAEKAVILQEKESLQAEFDAKNESLKEAEAVSKLLEKELENIKESLRALQKDNEEKQDKINEQQVVIDELNKQLAEARERLANKEEERTLSEFELSELKKKYEVIRQKYIEIAAQREEEQQAEEARIAQQMIHS